VANASKKFVEPSKNENEGTTTTLPPTTPGTPGGAGGGASSKAAADHRLREENENLTRELSALRAASARDASKVQKLLERLDGQAQEGRRLGKQLDMEADEN
jgi:hypothetical protein